MTFPAEEKIHEISAALAANKSVVFSAPPGSGKTTCVPAALLSDSYLEGKKIVVLEPRRLAARNAASYIARKFGEEVGGLVGYQVRLEKKVSSRTRLEIVTEGILAQRLVSDPELSDTACIIFDEFHERSLPCDLAFALSLETRRVFRPDLRIVVMSATLDPGPVAACLGDAVTIQSEGRMYPVEVRRLPGASVAAAVSKALEETEGDVLCFLPGEGEINRAMESVSNVCRNHADAIAMPLYGSLPKAEQDKVFSRSSERKVILSTSIAETSLTIEGVTAVVDTGLMRVSKFSPGTGMSSLVTLPVSFDRAEQRRGRAGRVRAGVCYRLWSESEDAMHPQRAIPEILDADLSSLVLSSLSWGATKRTDLPWMTPPPDAAWNQALWLLRSLGAVGEDGRLTPKGEKISRLPMHPRLANMIMEAGGSSDDEIAYILAAIVEEGVRSREVDIRCVLDEVRQTPNRPYSRRVLALAKRYSNSRISPSGKDLSEGALLALAYPDRIAANRGNGHFLMTSGRGAFLEEGDSLFKSPFIVCCNQDDRKVEAKVFLACPIKKEEIEDLFAADIYEENFCQWDRTSDRVKSVVRRKLGCLVLDEKRSDGDDCLQERINAFLDGVRLKGVENLPCWTKESRQLLDRVRFISRCMSGDSDSWPKFTDDEIVAALRDFVGGMNKWSDIAELDITLAIDSILRSGGHDRREVDRLAPERIEVPSGSKILVRYDGDEPTMEVRLQECFGLMASPRVVMGRVPVVMTLLSPAHRPIQVTKDLSGFWTGAYSLVRKDMRGRYPKHNWPEDPLSAVASRRTLK
jgi:ATP-dependent helicase HrpB